MSSATDKSKSPVILVIEDDPQIRRFLRTTLMDSGYNYLDAATAQEGPRQVGLQHSDLIILDLGLPDLDGLDGSRPTRR